jgi:DNA-binding transcriptional regulator YiaG
MKASDLHHAATHHERIEPFPTAAQRRAIRLRAGVSQAALADALGTTTKGVLRWETSERPPRMAHHDDAYRRVLGALDEYGDLIEVASELASGQR